MPQHDVGAVNFISFNDPDKYDLNGIVNVTSKARTFDTLVVM